MDIIVENFKKTGELHHAYCIEGERAELSLHICNWLEKALNFKIRANPDFFKLECDVLGIEEARMIKDRELGKPVTGDKKVFLIAFNFMGKEAQNALLKLFEEPRKGNYFFLATPSAERLLSTLRSRLFILSL